MQTDEQIKKALLNLPKDLPAMYAQILDQLQKSGATYQKRVLELVVASMRPLTVDEMREALSVTVGDTEWNPATLLNDVHSALTKNCGCLLVVDEEETTVRLLHPSVEQFLLNGYRNSDGNGITREGAQTTMTDIIVTYASYGVFDTQLSTIRVPQIHIESAPSQILASTLASAKGVQSFALKLLKSRKGLNVDIGSAVTNVLAQPDPGAMVLHFHTYVRSYGLKHTYVISEMTPHIAILFVALMKPNTILTGKESDRQTALRRAFLDNNEDALDLLLFLIDEGDNRPLSICTKAFISQPFNTFNDMTCLLLKACSYDFHTLSSQDMDSPLFFAIWARNAKAVELLLARDDVDINQMSLVYGNAPLREAIWYNSGVIIKSLINEDRIDIVSKEETLFWAVSYGNLYVVKLLLASGRLDLSDNPAQVILELANQLKNRKILNLIKQAAENRWHLPHLTISDSEDE
ncbi:hypothetical protein P153DRAFT_380981 [Dothidotthia symphoricarpi CBS 119687]|uniref:GPI inositol-deacylase winged helix domain-containing protein n=1 Tax=Dothidotthia symphoricarpi CBS 119687 TaxID=1392245 RepID=A0A6A6AS39_9PLEO|nr:uncharacterized protein P153DRAFT_380981 [Dothidotthia symphoricarpi CBS 119687]KAF2133805.1 hypothetical protein P153DRAFT_380981 [Dothidotthia symphoricarpi CBS 119687]